MAFPWISEANFEQGDRDSFTTTTDTQSKLDFPHYSTLAATPQLPMPYRGAYDMRIDLLKGNSDAFIEDTVHYTMANGSTSWARFAMWFGLPGGSMGRSFGLPTMADGDRFTVFRFASAGPVGECTVFIEFTTANGYRLGINKTLSPTNAQYLPFSLNRWVTVEAKYVSAAGAAGSVQLAVDGVLGTAVTGLTNAVLTIADLGAISVPATTTNGMLFFDQFVVDDLQVGNFARRFPQAFELTRSQHVLLGPGEIELISLIPSNNDNIVRIYDTDSAEVTDAMSAIAELRTDQGGVTVPVQFEEDFEVHRGAYVQLAGTNPRARVQLGEVGMAMTEGSIRAYGARRLGRRPNDGG